jgi:hypothetical protein
MRERFATDWFNSKVGLGYFLDRLLEIVAQAHDPHGIEGIEHCEAPAIETRRLLAEGE